MTTPVVTTPTVGRKVWYRPSKHDQQGPVPMQCALGQPLDATVIAVHGDRCVNVLVTDMVGRQFPVLSVTLVQDGETPPSDGEGVPFGRYVEWMPYQKGQAAKAASTALPVVDPGPDSLEREIQAKAAKGPRVTPADIEAEIVSEHYFTAEDGVFGALHTTIDDVKSRPATLGLLTFCVLMLRNGTKVVGINYGAIDPAQHCAEMGRKEARAQAVEKVWELLGFRLRDELARPVLTEADAAAELADVKLVPPHQQRVLDEKRELDERLSKLDAFILDNPMYLQLPTDEQDRLSRQSKAMAAYSGILDERIASF